MMADRLIGRSLPFEGRACRFKSYSAKKLNCKGD